MYCIDDVIQVYKARSGIEALFKDCKTGGYNLEGSADFPGDNDELK